MSESEHVTCRYCGRLHYLFHGRICQHCGVSTVPPVPEAEPDSEHLSRCPRCGVPTRAEATRCRSCGNVLPVIEDESPPPPLTEAEGKREIDLPEGPPVEIAKGPVPMTPPEEQSRDVDLEPGPPVELAKGSVKMDPPRFREVEIK